MRIFNGFEELKAAVGTEVGVSDWIEVTQDRINKFAEATCDEQMDPRRSGTCKGGDAGRQDHRAWFVVIEPDADVHCGR